MPAQAFAAIGLGLLVVSGVAKLIEPGPTDGALRAAHLPSGIPLARSLGAVEVLTGGLGLLWSGVVLVPAALLYAGFAAFTLTAMVGGRPIQSCGCFGKADTPPTWFHVVFNTLGVVSIGWVYLSDQPVIPWGEPAALVLGYLTFVALGTFASKLIFSDMAQTLTAVRSR